MRFRSRGDSATSSEPAVVATKPDTSDLVWGNAALALVQNDSRAVAVKPIVGGMINDEGALEFVMRSVIDRSVGRQRIFKPDVVFAVMSLLPGEQRRRLLELALRAGARTAYLVDTPIAAALGCGLDIPGPGAYCLVDIGEEKSEVAVIDRESVMALHCVSVGGDSPVEETVVQVASAVNTVLHDVTSVLRTRAQGHGIVMTGGGALAPTLCDQLMDAVSLPVRVQRDPVQCVVKGASVALDTLDVLRHNFAYIR